MSVFDVESFINEYYEAWSGTDEDRMMSYYADNVVLQIPGMLMEGKEALRNQFVRPFVTAFPGNRHLVKNMIFGPGVVTVEFSFEAEHKGPFGGHAATGARVKLPGCGVYEYDSVKRQITAGRIYFDVGTLLQTITDVLVEDREKAEEGLQTDERKLSSIANVVPTFIHVLRSDGSVLYVNQPMLGYTGLTLDDVRKEDYRARVFHAEDVERLREERGEALRCPVPFENEERLLDKDGKYRWFLIRYNPLLDKEGRIDRWYAAAFDIEDRKRAEEAQARQTGVRADVNAAFSRATDLGEILRGCTEAIVRYLDAAFARIWIVNKDEGMLELQASAGMYTRLDGSYSRIPVGDLKVGWIARERKAVFTNDVMNDPRVNDKGWAQSNGMMAFAGYPLVVEDRLIGVVALFARRPLPETILDTLASVAGTIAQGIERKRAETELRRAYDSFADAQRLSKTGSFITDLVGDDHNWSEEAYRIFEFGPSTKITVQRIREVIHPDDLPAFESVIARGMTGENVTFAFRIVTAHGPVKHVRGVAHVIENVKGRPMFVGALQDVTDSVVAEEALNKARSDLAHVARVATVSTLTASIAHEISQPLSGIITNAGTCLRMLAADPPDVDGARETARRTIRDGNRASDVITRLRALFSKKEFAPESFDLNDAAREVIALSLSELQRHRVIVQSELADDLPKIAGDRIQLQQVIMNLVRNASDAMTAVDDRPRQLLVRTEREHGDRVRLTVRDDGVGFDRQGLDKLFDAFYTTKSGGMGIGLSVSRSIIESHHGRLWAEPNDGPGATFSFSIPCAQESVSNAAPAIYTA